MEYKLIPSSYTDRLPNFNGTSDIISPVMRNNMFIHSAGLMRYAQHSLITAAAAAILAGAPASASAKLSSHTDRGKEICFPLGPLSFANARPSLETGDTAPGFSGARIAETALSEPDNDPARTITENVTLGRSSGRSLSLQISRASRIVISVLVSVSPAKQ